MITIEREVVLPVAGVVLPGDMTVPERPSGVVVFAHGSGSSRFSPRNLEVARFLNDNGFATLLFDLLSEEEALDQANVFDVWLLASRLGDAAEWLRRQPETEGLPCGYFGASTGAAAALWAAAEPGAPVRAIVSRGGRPDLAATRLGLVHAPTLLVVGGDDRFVVHLNREAVPQLRSCEHELEVVPGASHLFDEPGALEHVCELAAAWFQRYLPSER